MALWIELHCDVDSPGCWNEQNYFPDQGFAPHRRERLVRRVKEMEEKAVIAGWRCIRGRWHCPICALEDTLRNA
jgi:hypothetical protein